MTTLDDSQDIEDAKDAVTPANNTVLLDRYSQSVMNTFGLPKKVLAKGKGTRVWDADGKEYLDFLGGIATNALGHAHPAWTAALEQQAKTLGHISNFFTSVPQIEAAEKVLSVVTVGPAPKGARVFFSNSGTEANEAALKIARHYGGTSRPRILALEHSFHGRSLGALSATWKESYREPFAPLLPGIEFIAATASALEQAMGPDVAALIVEPIQGEAGVVPLPDGFLGAARQLTSNYGALLILDEVQTGVGRCGVWMAHHLMSLPDGSAIVPDVITLAKGLGAGFPVGACVTLSTAVSSVLGPGQHGTTFGGNPLASACVLTTLNTIAEENLLDNATQLGLELHDAILRLGNPLISRVHGAGLLIGIHLREDKALEIVADLLDAGVIANAATPNVVRVAPPLNVSETDVQSFLTIFADVINKYGEHK